MRLLTVRFFQVLIFISIWISCEEQSEKPKEVKEEVRSEAADAFKLQSFPFVGRWYGKTGIFKYDLASRKYKTIWWNTREDVIMLIYKPEDRPAFFLTSTKYGIKGNFPFINKIRLYRINNETYRAEKISDIGSGVQMTAHWNDDEHLEVIYTAVDQTKSFYVNKYKQVYNPLGKLIDDEIETFDIEKDGFPQLLPKRSKTLSGSGNYGITSVNDSVFLKTAEDERGTRQLKFITTISHDLNKVEWSSDEEFLFFSTIDLGNESIKTKKPETSELFVYSIKKDFDRNCKILIYNYRTMELINEIKVSSGCGLVYLPEMER
jgi:hypothetical protein